MMCDDGLGGKGGSTLFSLLSGASTSTKCKPASSASISIEKWVAAAGCGCSSCCEMGPPASACTACIFVAAPCHLVAGNNGTCSLQPASTVHCFGKPVTDQCSMCLKCFLRSFQSQAQAAILSGLQKVLQWVAEPTLQSSRMLQFMTRMQTSIEDQTDAAHMPEEAAIEDLLCCRARGSWPVIFSTLSPGSATNWAPVQHRSCSREHVISSYERNVLSALLITSVT